MENINLIRRAAWSFHRTTNVDYDELFSEASLAYMVCLERKDRAYDPSKSSFNTWAYQCMTLWLITYCNKLKANPETDDLDAMLEQEILAGNECSPEQIVEFHSELNTLSDEAKAVCKAIFESPMEFLSHAPKLSRGKVKEYLREQGWSWSSIWKTFSEIKLFLNKTA